MRAVIQRVTSAEVSVEGEIVGSIDCGLLVLVGKEDADTVEDIDWLASKIVGLRIFADEAGTMNRSVQDIGGDILLVSQFTLFASTKKGTRPSWHRAARPGIAIPLYEAMTRKLGALLGRPIQTGRFGAMMQVNLVNDGPVTLIIDTKIREYAQPDDFRGEPVDVFDGIGVLFPSEHQQAAADLAHDRAIHGDGR